ncbi:unnamed protein product [Durusdinium trenchii]|uniref:N-terminally processed] n=2 Tax=Durusdinium trenchii TaxID=1381693 RepID=A0ABP0S6R9_9DINO
MDFGGFPGGARGPSHSSHAELAQLRARLAQEERAIAHFKHKGPTELWSFMPSDGQPLNLRVAPHLDAAHTGHVLAPGDRFEVAEKSFHDEVTYLRLRDGRGWAFDGKPVLRSGWWPFASGSEKMVLCVPVHQQVHQGLMHSGPPPAAAPAAPEPPAPALLGRTLPREPQVLKSDVPSVFAPSGATSAVEPSPDSPKVEKPKLHVRVQRAHALRNMDFGSFFGNKSDPYVVVRFGAEEKKTPVIDDNLDPVWSDGSNFAFLVPDEAPKLIELEVFNSNTFVDDSLGKTSIVFSTLKPDGRWLHRRDPLLGKSMVAPAEGELEYEVMLDAKTGARTVDRRVRASGPGQPPPPPEDLEPGLYKVGLRFPLEPGLYKVTMSTAVYRSSTKCNDREVVAHVTAGQQVKVEEVLNCLSEERVRGHITEPRGWIPLLDTRDGFRWAAPVVQQKYLVDNTWLKSPCGGLAYRFSKEVQNKDERPGEQGGAPWNSMVIGEDQGDGWLKVADGRLLPMSMNGVPVLKPLADADGSPDEVAQAEEELDRLYRELNRRMEGVSGSI